MRNRIAYIKKMNPCFQGFIHGPREQSTALTGPQIINISNYGPIPGMFLNKHERNQDYTDKTAEEISHDVIMIEAAASLGIVNLLGNTDTQSNHECRSDSPDAKPASGTDGEDEHFNEKRDGEMHPLVLANGCQKTCNVRHDTFCL